jgi:hypothetical protein
LALLDFVAVDEPDHAGGATVNITGTEALPALPTLMVTMVLYVPEARPVVLTATETWAVFLMAPVPGDRGSQAALSVATQVAGRLFCLEKLTV